MWLECQCVDKRSVLVGAVVLKICRILILIIAVCMSARREYFPTPPLPDWSERMSRGERWLNVFFMAVYCPTVMRSLPIWTDLSVLVSHHEAPLFLCRLRLMFQLWEHLSWEFYGMLFCVGLKNAEIIGFLRYTHIPRQRHTPGCEAVSRMTLLCKHTHYI